MTTRSKVFNSLFGADGPLEFREPILARKTEREKGGDVFMPSFPAYFYSGHLKKPKESSAMYRNIIAWYLKAAGLTGKEIGDFLSISASRANQLALRTQKQIFDTHGTISSMEMLAKSEKLDGEIKRAHMLRGMRQEMIAAEYALFRCVKQDLFVVSGALRIGRERYSAACNKVAGTRCPCRYCAIFKNEEQVAYWSEESNGKS